MCDDKEAVFHVIPAELHIPFYAYVDSEGKIQQSFIKERLYISREEYESLYRDKD